MKPYVLKKDVWEYLLKERECTTSDLMEHFKKQAYTKQGIYRVLRVLEKEGRVILLRKYVTVNLMWVQDEIEKLTSLTTVPQLFFDTFDTKRTYRMNTLEELDRVWGQLFVLILAELKVPPTHALFYDLHNYTYIHKVPIVEWYIRQLYKKIPKICLLVGSHSPLDTILKKNIKHIAVHLGEKKWQCFVAVIGDYVICNYLDRSVWTRVDQVFEGTDTHAARDELLFLSHITGSYRITVEKNANEARGYLKYFRKYFAIP